MKRWCALFFDEDYYVGLLSTEIIFQFVLLCYLGNVTFVALTPNEMVDMNQYNIMLHQFFSTHWSIFFIVLIMSFVGDICLLIAKDNWNRKFDRRAVSYDSELDEWTRVKTFNAEFYTLCSIIFGGNVVLTPILFVLLILSGLSKITDIIISCNGIF